MTAALLIITAHTLDLATLLIVSNAYGISGEANPIARTLFAIAGIAGLVFLKGIGTALLVVLSRSSRLRLTLSVLAGLAGALVNAVAWHLLA